MANKYEFHVDAAARDLCDEIVEQMRAAFGIAMDEALGRINRHWHGIDFENDGNDIRFHQPADFWASDIYYGPTSYWWMNPPGLNPQPYP